MAGVGLIIASIETERTRELSQEQALCCQWLVCPHGEVLGDCDALGAY